MGNIVNRVFDSSGPEGKVRGTPQQIIDKYQVLARDAQLSNDRVAAENFLQHSEHYTRMLSEAQREAREAEARREPQQNGQGRGRAQDEQGGGQSDAAQGEDGDTPQSQQSQPQQSQQPQSQQPSQDGGGAVIDVDGKDGDGSGLVETPEATASDDDAPAQGQDDKPAGDGAARKTTRAPARRRSPAKSAKSDNGNSGNSGDGESGGSTANSVAE